MLKWPGTRAMNGQPVRNYLLLRAPSGKNADRERPWSWRAAPLLSSLSTKLVNT